MLRNSPIRLIVLPLEACVAEIIKLKPPFERPSWTFYSNIYIMSTIPYNYTQATERNSEARSTSVTVQISVLDINDNAPLFEFQSYEVNVTESAQMGYSVLNLTATDSDEVRMQGLILVLSKCALFLGNFWRLHLHYWRRGSFWYFFRRISRRRYRHQWHSYDHSYDGN